MTLTGRVDNGMAQVKKATEHAEHSASPTRNMALTESTLGDHARVHIGDVTSYYLGKGCVADLRVTDPRLDMVRLEATKGPLIQECYGWIFEHPEFTAWRKHDKNSVLWINGDPGKGKTMLLMGIIRALSWLKSDANPIYVSYFFCERGDPRLKSATSVLRGLIYMIVMEKSELMSLLEAKYNYSGRQLFEDVNAFYALSEIFRDMVNRLQVVLVVDAIDECKEGLPQLLDLIDQTKYASSKVKWVVSSRCTPDIIDRMRAGSNVVNLNLEVNARYVSSSVEAYINQKLPVLAEGKGYDGQLYNTVREYLQTRAEGTFLWVSAVCKALECSPRRKAFSAMKSFPEDLRVLYQHMLSEVQAMDDTEDTESCMRLLDSMVSYRRPMRLIELGAYSGLPSDYIKDQDVLKELVDLCGSFLTVRDDIVYIVHNSARDFLAAEVSCRNTKEASQVGFRFLPSRPGTSQAMYK